MSARSECSSSELKIFYRLSEKSNFAEFFSYNLVLFKALQEKRNKEMPVNDNK